MRGKSKAWLYSGGCEYESKFHHGKVEWHHLCSKDGMVGIFLCEAHHSVLQGRSRRYDGEVIINKSLAEMKQEIQELVNSRVIAVGLSLKDIDKN